MRHLTGQKQSRTPRPALTAVPHRRNNHRHRRRSGRCWQAHHARRIRPLSIRHPAHNSNDDHDERREIDRWLVDYLTSGGSANARDVIRDGRASGFTEDAVKKARRRVGATSERQGFGKGSTVVWTIDAPMDAIDARNQKPESMSPMVTYAESGGAEEPTEGTEELKNQRVSPSSSSVSSSDSEPACTVCGFPLHAFLIADGQTTHPNCEETT
jgi:hypothetical protein